MPVHAVREDGWAFSISIIPQAHEMPGWLLAALGAKVG